MHLLVRENRTLDEQDTAEDLGLPGADIVVLSFTESDLLGLRHAEQHLRASGHAAFPSVQVTSLARLRHPMSVDLYVEHTLHAARCVVVRLLGGVDYWRYGAEELAQWARERSVPVVFLPGHAGGMGSVAPMAQEDDTRLADLSYGVQAEQRQRLSGFFAHGGPQNMQAALWLMAALAGAGQDDGAQPRPLAPWGVYRTLPATRGGEAGRVACSAVIVFYRAHLQAADMAGVDRLAEVLAGQGCTVELLFVTSLKDQAVAQGVAGHLRSTRPDVVLNATCFSARGVDALSPLDGAGAPVLQVLQPGSTQALWAGSARGLARSDLAMQVVLPELDGTVATFPIAFRQEEAPGLPARRAAYEPGIRMVAARAMAWARLRHTPVAQKRIGIVLSDYPGAGLEQAGAHVAHAVGLDGFASLHNIIQRMHAQGYGVGGQPVPTAQELAELMVNQPAQVVLSVAEYKALCAELNTDFMDSVTRAWGAPEQDGAVREGVFYLRYAALGSLTLAIQPDRGRSADRKTLYHDPDVPPCHAYVAFYLWLRCNRRLDALVHLGTHGTLEWLPGKATALSPACAPAVLVGDMPVIYPFIVNNPGEAAAARRRLGAVTIGHMTPPVMQGHLSGEMYELERLIDEYAEADGLDPRRSTLLRADILERAARTGVLAESGVRTTDVDESEALARLDAYLCDVKDLQIRDGLHVFGKTAPRGAALVQTIAQACGREQDPAFVADVTQRINRCGKAEMDALLAALAGQPVAAGPAGAPTRGRIDVLPTGRNLFTVDPRALPTPSAVVLAARMEQVLLTRHIQEHGEHLTRLVMDMWGSASLRTGGEDLALALRLMGVEVQRAAGTGHVCGFEVIPLPVLDRPRVDVTLRISGLFRDAFAEQIALFDQAVSAVADRREPDAWNPLAAQVRGLEGAARKRASARIFGAAAGAYGTGVEEHLLHGTWASQTDLGAAWLEGSSWMYGGGREGTRDEAALSALLGQAETVLHVQDNAETDLLESPDIAAHEGGLAAASHMAGGAPAILHGDTSRPQTPRLRATADEVARIVRGRLANPQWIEGMQRHGYAGAAELARGLDALHGFAATMPQRFDRQFDLVFAATLGDAACDDFLRNANPAAREALRQRFAEALRRGLWHPRGNSVARVLDGDE